LALDAQFTVLSPQRSLFKLHGFISNLGFFLQIIRMFCYSMSWHFAVPGICWLTWESKNLLGSHFFRGDYPMGQGNGVYTIPLPIENIETCFSNGLHGIFLWDLEREKEPSLVGIQPGLLIYYYMTT
jgi:hypothetical protein